jgi:CRISPR-associated endonuclease/helicase Cas3
LNSYFYSSNNRCVEKRPQTNRRDGPVAPTFYVHSTKNPDESDWPTLPAHLNAVGELAGQFAAPFNSTLLAQTAGKLHDLGKYTEPFQKRLRGGAKVDHATWGAQVACERCGALG